MKFAVVTGDWVEIGNFRPDALSFRSMQIDDEYDRIMDATIQAWTDNPGPGAPRDLPDGYHRYGISVGSFFQPTPALKPLLSDIADLANVDTNHVTIPAASYHFTFLALASHTFGEADPLPPEVSDLKHLCRSFLHSENWSLSRLRLLPGANFLLLVGTPSPELVELRERFGAALLASSWRPFVASRHEYRGYPFPPRIWHTTLCRYKAEFLPKQARDLFVRYRDRDFGSIELEPPRLRRVNYDWSSTTILG